jgi:protocatechuate 3,4-dioxygenase beta subunit
MLKNYLSNPPHFFKAYKSNINRAPRKKFFTITNDTYKRSKLKVLSKNFNMNNNLLLFKKNKSPIGQKIIIKGKVINSKGNPLKGIIIEIWQANAAGKYRDKNDTHDAAIDPNFLGYGATKTNSNGDYEFKTILPGAYPWENHKNAWRPKHIHFSIINENISNRLCTQMYFPNDFLLNYDPIFKSIAKTYRNSLIAKFDYKNNIIPNYLVFTFNIVL